MIRPLMLSMFLGTFMMIVQSGQAQAQYSHGLYYDNGRFAYGQSWSIDRNGFSNGFYIRTPQHSHYSRNAFRNGWHSGSFHQARRGNSYGHRYAVGGKYNRGGTYSRRR